MITEMASEVKDKPLVIAGKTYGSRLITGTGKYKTLDLMKEALEASGSEMVTVAVRRVDLADRSEKSFWQYLPKGMDILPNTAGCYNLADALRCARLARELVNTSLIKLEIIADVKTLLPDTEALLEGTKILEKEGFKVLAYTNDDPIMARKLEKAGAAAVMPLAAPIGTGQGILNPLNIRFIRDTVKSVPLILDAGVGTASHAAEAMELGADAVLMIAAIAEARDPAVMARAMNLGIQAGRLAYLAGRMPIRPYASASSPAQK